jgi:hypothetical protein
MPTQNTAPDGIGDGPIIHKMKHFMKEKKPFYSFEYFPPKSEAGVQNLYARLDRMSMLEPLFMDVTWGAGGTTADLTMELSVNAQKWLGNDVMMHLTCTNQTIEMTRKALEDAKAGGIRNILYVLACFICVDYAARCCSFSSKTLSHTRISSDTSIILVHTLTVPSLTAGRCAAIRRTARRSGKRWRAASATPSISCDSFAKSTATSSESAWRAIRRVTCQLKISTPTSST